MPSITKEYKSPIHKLLPFFERSRDRWKEKCTTAKAVVKRRNLQIARLTSSRQRWKELARERGRELDSLRRELAEQKR